MQILHVFAAGHYNYMYIVLKLVYPRNESDSFQLPMCINTKNHNFFHVIIGASIGGNVSRQINVAFIPPSHRRRGVTAVLVRHKPQWHRHDRRGSTVVPSLIIVTPRKTVKTSAVARRQLLTCSAVPPQY